MSSILKHWKSKVPKSSHQRQWTEWALNKGHSPIQVSLALNAVTMADDFVRYFTAIDNRQLSFAPTYDELKQWHQFWMNRDVLWNTLLDEFFASEEYEHRPSVYVRWCRITLKRWPKMTAEKRRGFVGDIDRDALYDVVQLGRELAITVLDEALDEAYRGTGKAADCDISPGAELAAKFMLRVALPAYLVFGYSHDELYRQAVEESQFLSLQRLLRLDPASRQLPGVAERINHLIRSGQSQQAATLEDEAIRPVTMNSSKVRTACKAVLIGWVIDQSNLSKGKRGLGKPFTVPDLERLFNAHASDRFGLVRDEDLQESPQALRKMVTRMRELMKVFFWDIFRVLDVPQF